MSRGVRVVPAPRLSILLLGASAWALLFLNILNVNFLLQILARWIGEGETIWCAGGEKLLLFNTGSCGGWRQWSWCQGCQAAVLSPGPFHSYHRSPSALGRPM